MKTKESSNRFEGGRDISPSVSQAKMQETAKLQGKNSGDGREQSYKFEKESGEEKDESSMKNEITGQTEQEDVKKEFEIRSGKDSEKESGISGEKTEKDPVGEEETKIEGEKDTSQGAWRRSYKGDAEIVT
jgi:hypothetical protein